MSRRMGVYAQLRDKLKYAGSVHIDSTYRYGSGLAAITSKYVVLAGGYGGALYNNAYACNASLTASAIDGLQEAKYEIGSASSDKYAFFISGRASGNITTADAYNGSLTHTALPVLQTVYGSKCGAAMVGNNLVVAGRLKYAEYYNSALTLVTLGMPFGKSMDGCSAVSVGNKAIFKTASKAYVFDSSLSVTEANPTSYHEAGKQGILYSNKVVFCDSSSSYNAITLYSSTDFSKSTIASISPVRFRTILAIAGLYMLIAGGYVTTSNYSKVVDVYDSTFTAQKAKALPSYAYNGRSECLGNYAIIGGFETTSESQSNGTVLHVLKYAG